MQLHDHKYTYVNMFFVLLSLHSIINVFLCSCKHNTYIYILFVLACYHFLLKYMSTYEDNNKVGVFAYRMFSLCIFALATLCLYLDDGHILMMYLHIF